jgi:hypothetical protein
MREFMLREIDRDIADDVLVFSKRFSDVGSIGYPPLLRSAVSDHNEAWLAEHLIGSFNATELSAGKPKAIPRNAHTLFAQCEFNRFYCRALCLYVLANLIMASEFTGPENRNLPGLNLKPSLAECLMLPSS